VPPELGRILTFCYQIVTPIPTSNVLNLPVINLKLINLKVMSNNIKQKILAIGNPLTVCRLSAKIDADQFVVTGCESPAEADILLEREHFDVVIVDNLVPGAEKVCKKAAIMSDTPVALLLQDKLVDWRGLGELKVDGFILDGGTRAEFMARVRAYIRRKPSDSTLTKNY
jgi:hypothetical protein